MTPRSAVVLGVAIAVLAVAPPVSAQAPAQAAQPQRGSRSIEVLGLQVGTTVSSGDLPEETVFPGVTGLPEMGSQIHSDIQAALQFQPLPGDRLNYGINLQSAVRRYQSSEEFMVLGHSAGGHIGLNAGRRVTLSGYASASHLPAYGFNLGPGRDLFALAAATEAGQLSVPAAAAGQLPSTAVDYSLVKRTMMSLSGGGALQYTVTRRLGLQMAYQQTRQEFRRDEDPDLQSQQAAGRLTYRLNRFLGLRMGFQRRYADYLTPRGIEVTVLDDIDIGLESAYGRQVNLTRSTTLSFNTGSTVTHRNGERGLQLTGGAHVMQRLGRTGELTVGVTRGTELREGFEEPIFANSLITGVRFDVAQNLTASVTGTGTIGQTLGQRGEQATADHVRGYQASARLSYIFLRRGMVYGQYLVSGHDLGGGVGIIGGVARKDSYRSLRAGVLWSVTLASQRPPRETAAPAQGDN